MAQQYYLRADIVDTSEQLMVLQQMNDDIIRRSGIQHNLEIIDRGTSRIVLVSVDYELFTSGEYERRMTDLAQGVLLKIIDQIEEAAYEEMMKSPLGEEAARMTENFFNKTRH